MFEDIFKSVQQYVADRIVSPLIGAFAVSWCIWNYKFIVILLSEEPVRVSFQMIDELAYPTRWSLFAIGFLGPFFTSITYIFLYPYPAKFVYNFTRRRQRELLDLKREIEDETPLTIEESRKLKLEAIRQQQSFYEQLERREREVEKLQQELKELRALQEHDVESDGEDLEFQEDDGSDVSNGKRSVLSQSQMMLLRLIGEGASQKAEFMDKDRSSLEVDFDLDELLGAGLIERYPIRGGGRSSSAYRITQEGRRIVLGVA